MHSSVDCIPCMMTFTMTLTLHLTLNFVILLNMLYIDLNITIYAYI